MTATVEPDEGPMYLAWCLPCQNGMRDTQEKATAWAAAHNAANHPEEQE